METNLEAVDGSATANAQSQDGVIALDIVGDVCFHVGHSNTDGRCETVFTE